MAIKSEPYSKRSFVILLKSTRTKEFTLERVIPPNHLSYYLKVAVTTSVELKLNETNGIKEKADSLYYKLKLNPFRLLEYLLTCFCNCLFKIPLSVSNLWRIIVMFPSCVLYFVTKIRNVIGVLF